MSAQPLRRVRCASCGREVAAHRLRTLDPVLRRSGRVWTPVPHNEPGGYGCVGSQHLQRSDGTR